MGSLLRGTVIHLDDVYPGWDGLVAGRDHVIESVLKPLASGESGAFTSWDWNLQRPGPEIEVHPTDVLIVEGCGISTAASRELAHTVLWVECIEAVRRDRLRERDEGRFDRHREEWEAQMSAHVAANDPRGTATAIVETSTK